MLLLSPLDGVCQSSSLGTAFGMLELPGSHPRLSGTLGSFSCHPRLPPFFLESQDPFCQRRATALTSLLLLFPSMSKDLSELMKEATKEVHEQAENTPFMKNFQKGQVSLHEFKVRGSSIAGE